MFIAADDEGAHVHPAVESSKSQHEHLGESDCLEAWSRSLILFANLRVRASARRNGLAPDDVYDAFMDKLLPKLDTARAVKNPARYWEVTLRNVCWDLTRRKFRQRMQPWDSSLDTITLDGRLGNRTAGDSTNEITPSLITELLDYRASIVHQLHRTHPQYAYYFDSCVSGLNGRKDMSFLLMSLKQRQRAARCLLSILREEALCRASRGTLEPNVKSFYKDLAHRLSPRHMACSKTRPSRALRGLAYSQVEGILRRLYEQVDLHAPSGEAGRYVAQARTTPGRIRFLDNSFPRDTDANAANQSRSVVSRLTGSTSRPLRNRSKRSWDVVAFLAGDRGINDARPCFSQGDEWWRTSAVLTKSIQLPHRHALVLGSAAKAHKDISAVERMDLQVILDHKLAGLAKRDRQMAMFMLEGRPAKDIATYVGLAAPRVQSRGGLLLKGLARVGGTHSSDNYVLIELGSTGSGDDGLDELGMYTDQC